MRSAVDSLEQHSARGPVLVPQQPPRLSRSVLALWHLLSLDAPTVATVWTVFVARSVGIHLGWAEPAAMFVAVWMIYAADRLLDAASAMDKLEERHRFHAAGKRWFTAGLIGAAIVLVAVMLRVDTRGLRLDALLTVLLGVWMLLIHVRSPGSNTRLPKEVAVGLFFPAAVFIPTVARMPWMRLQLLPSAILFAGVCAMNCVLLFAWEHPAGDERAHWTTRCAVRHAPWLAGGLLLACCAMAARGDCLAMACGLSAVLMGALHFMRRHVSAVHLRALADLALLTPLPWLLR